MSAAPRKGQVVCVAPNVTIFQYQPLDRFVNSHLWRIASASEQLVLLNPLADHQGLIIGPPDERQPPMMALELKQDPLDFWVRWTRYDR